MKRLITLYAVIAFGCMGLASDIVAKCEKKRNLSTDYEVSISNNTNKTMHWHLKTTGEDCNEDLKPGQVKNFFVTGGDLLDQLEVDFKEEGQETETRGYKIPSAQSGRDWLFTVDGEPFTGNWSVCGMWKPSVAQGSLIEYGPEIVAGVAAAAIVVGTLGAGTGAGAAEYAITVAALEAGTALLLASQLGTAAVVTLAAAGAAGAGALTDELLDLASEMTFDKCEWVYNERITLKNGSSDYMMVIQDGEKSTGVLPGKTFVVREALAGDTIKVKAYLESEQDSLGEDDTVKRGSVAFTQDSEGVVHIEKSGDNYNGEPATSSRNTVFRNKIDMPISIIREQKMTEPVEILAAKEVDAAGKEVFDQVDSNHTLSDDFRYYSYTDASPVESELAIDFKHTDATIKVNKGSGSSKGSVTLSYDK